MAHKIFLSPLARQDIIETADYIREHGSAERATRWASELVKVIAGLGEMPERCPLADESHDVGLQLRELHYHSHRVIFRVDDATSTVQILRLYHSSRAPLRLEDIEWD